MDTTQALEYINTEYITYFAKPVTAQTLKRWIGKGRIADLTQEALDKAITTGKIPPKRGRPARFTDCDKDGIIAASETMSRGQVAKLFECSASYVSLVVRGLR